MQTACQLIDEQQNAVETATTQDRLSSLSTTQFDRLRDYLLSDSYAFTKIVCRHLDLVPEFHMPLSYVMCGLPHKLVPLLNDKSFDSYATKTIRRELWRRHIDWNTPEGFARLADLLDFVNIRVYRGSFKSSIGTHGGALFTATRDPNETIWIVSNSDDNAWAFCEQIGETIRENPFYRALFPERIPDGNLKELITQKRITLGGRNISHPQATIEADGYLSKRISAHFSTFWVDDLVVKENSTPAHIKNVTAWLAGMPGFEMATRRIRRIHQGTIWSYDDNRFLTTGKLGTECLTLTIPIEVYENGYVDNVLARGEPTNPKLHSVAKIQKLQDKVLSDPDEGAISWRCNYLLDASAGGGSIFPQSLVYDPERSWSRLPHPKRPLDFLVSRLARDKEGKKIEREKWDGSDDDPHRYLWKRFDPMRELDRVITVDPAWAETGGDNWAVSCTGDDPDAVRFDLYMESGEDGLDGWVEAVADMAEGWRPRIIGFDANAMQDAMVKNMLKTDRRLKRIRNLFVPVRSKNTSKKSRITAFVAERLRMYRLLFNPDNAPFKDEALAYKGDPRAVDGMLDAVSMAEAVHVKKLSKEDRDERLARLAARNAAIVRSVDPYTGIPYVAA